MGLLSRMEARSGLANPAPWLVDALTNGSSRAGVSVTHDKALGLTAFWNGVRIISQTIASLPLEVFERQERGRRAAREHPVDRLLRVRPNPHMTPFTFKEIRAAHCLTWGNSFAEIERDRGNRPVALWPLLPDRTGVEVRNGEKLYWTVVNGTKVWLAEDRVLHVPGLGFDGLQGYNVIRVHRESLGLAIAANEYGAAFFGNSGRPSGYLKHPGKPSKEDREQFREEWNQVHTGLTNAQRTAILWGGMEWHAVSLPPEEAQFLGTRSMAIDDIARILNINPILLQKTEGATTWGTAIGHFLVAFAKFTIAPWLEREEDAYNWALFREDERDRFYVKYNIAALLRGDLEAQAKVLEIKRRNGVINADEWRALDDENPLPDGLGQTYWMPLNMAPVQQIAERPPETLPAPQRSLREHRALTSRRRLQQQFAGLFRDTERRLVAKEAAEVRAAVEKYLTRRNAEDFLRWLDDFYARHRRYTEERWMPVYRTYAEAVVSAAAEEIGRADAEWTPDLDRFLAAYVASHAALQVRSALGQMRQIVREALATAQDPAPFVEQRLQEWMERRPVKVAMQETVQAQNAVAREVFRTNGIQKLRWSTGDAKNCPYCNSLDGKVVGIDGFFLPAGVDFQPEGTDRPLKSSVNIHHPPAHDGCSCVVVPAI